MSEKFQENVTVLKQQCIGKDIYDMTIQTKHIAGHAKAGQFVSLYSNDASKLLPRPISLCGIDAEAGTLRLVYRVTGEGTGTEEFSRLKAGDTIRVLGPLGNGFTVEPGKKAFLIGGGIGIPPMLELAKSIKAAGTCEFVSVMGYRDAQTFLLDEFKEQGDCYVATEDGSVGAKGNVLDAMKEYKLNADVIYACGPTPMLRALKAYAAEQGMTCYISMEERMACGIGACLACVCVPKKRCTFQCENRESDKEGPVFLAEEGGSVMNTSVELCGVTLKNPVMTASGTFGSGAEYSEFTDLNRLGAVVTKGVANVPWPGNPTPRVAEVYGRGCSTPWDCRIRELICSAREIFHS